MSLAKSSKPFGPYFFFRFSAGDSFFTSGLIFLNENEKDRVSAMARHVNTTRISRTGSNVSSTERNHCTHTRTFGFEGIEREHFRIAEQAGELFKQQPPRKGLDQVSCREYPHDGSQRICFLGLDDIAILPRLSLLLLGGFKFLFAAILLLLGHGLYPPHKLRCARLPRQKERGDSNGQQEDSRPHHKWCTNEGDHELRQRFVDEAEADIVQ